MHVQGVTAETGYREANEAFVVPSSRRVAPSRRERFDSKGHGRFSSGCLSRALLDPRESPVLAGPSPEIAGVVVHVALPRGGEDPRQAAGRRGQVQAQEEVSVAEDHLGRRGGRLLFQGAIEERAETVLHEDQVSVVRGEEEPREGDRVDPDSGGELVQESTAERSDAADENGYVAVKLPERREQRDRRLREQRRQSSAAEHRLEQLELGHVTVVDDKHVARGCKSMQSNGHEFYATPSPEIRDTRHTFAHYPPPQRRPQSHERRQSVMLWTQ